MVDNQAMNGAFNSSFLVLNLGTNTLGLGNSSMKPTSSESSHRVSTEKNPAANVADGNDSLSCSAEEGSSSAESDETNRFPEEKEDPDWVPEEESKRTDTISSCRNPKPKYGTSINSQENLQSAGSKSYPSPREGVGGVPNPVSGSLPNHLMELFRLNGWKAVSKGNQGEYMYISPSGRSYSSLQQAFGAYMQDTSKYNHTPGFSPSYFVDNTAAGSALNLAGPSCSNTKEPRDNAPVDAGKRKRTRRKSTSKLPSNEKSSEHTDAPVRQNEGNKRTAGDLVKELNKMDCGNTLANNLLIPGRLPKAKRSARTRRRHVPAENENIWSGSEVSGNKSKDTKKTPSVPQAETGQREMPRACGVNVDVMDSAVRRSDSSDSGVKRCDQSRDKQLAGLRRSGRLNKPENAVEASVVRRDVGNTGRLEDERNGSIQCNPFCNENQGFYRSGPVLSSKSNIQNRRRSGDRNSIRRSRRINGKRVPVDDSDAEYEVDDELSDRSDFDATIRGMREKENPIPSFFQTDNEGGTSFTNSILPLQTSTSNPGCPKYGFMNVPASLKEIGSRIHAPVKHAFSSAARAPDDSAKPAVDKNKTKRRGGCGLMVRRNEEDYHQEETSSNSNMSILSWLIDCGILTEKETIFYITKNNTGNTATGFITRRGIWCSCCDNVMTLLKFIAHAGGSVQHPWDSTFLMSGKSILSCMKEAWEREKKQRKIGFQTVGVGDKDPSDDTCGICADGGQLLCCDNCPSTFHQKCVMLKALPKGSWFCPYCRCKFCKATVQGLSPTPNFLSCKQCGRKYHQECAWRNDMQMMGPLQHYFCGGICKRVAARLSEMLGKANPMQEGFSWTLLKRFDEQEEFDSNRSPCFILESNIKLSMALSILHECFVPLVDQRTDLDMICQAIYNSGSNFSRLNYEGYYTLILEKDEEIISAASLRVHGTSLAEMPFIGTRPIYRRQGMCRRLLNVVEAMLTSLNVEELIIPAIPDLLDTWNSKFGFKPLEQCHKDEIKDLSMMVFTGTTLLQKTITKASVPRDVAPDNNSIRQTEIMQARREQPRTFGSHLYSGGLFYNAYNLTEQRNEIPFHSRVFGVPNMTPGFSSFLPRPNMTPGSSSFPPPIPNLSIWNSNPVQTTHAMNLRNTAHNPTATTFHPSVNMDLDDDRLDTETMTTQTNLMSTWSQGGNEVKDLQLNAIKSNLSFESLLRMSG